MRRTPLTTAPRRLLGLISMRRRLSSAETKRDDDCVCVHVNLRGVCVCVSGLQLILNVNQDEYISEGDDAAGMRLVIHQAQRMPFPEDEGLAINPGQTTSIGLRRVATRNCLQ